MLAKKLGRVEWGEGVFCCVDLSFGRRVSGASHWYSYQPGNWYQVPGTVNVIAAPSLPSFTAKFVSPLYLLHPARSAMTVREVHKSKKKKESGFEALFLLFSALSTHGS